MRTTPNRVKAVTPAFVVGIIGILVVFLITATTLIPAIKNFIAGPKLVDCASDLVFRTIVEELTLGIGDVPVKCTTKQLHVTMDTVSEYQDKALRDVRENQRKPLYSPEHGYYSTTYPDEYVGGTTWAFANIIADEMAKCHYALFQGALDLHKANVLQSLLEKNQHLCIRCAHITLDKDVAYRIGESIDVVPWLKDHNYEKTGQNYYDLFKGQSLNAERRIGLNPELVYGWGTVRVHDETKEMTSTDVTPRKIDIVFIADKDGNNAIVPYNTEELGKPTEQYSGTWTGLRFGRELGGGTGGWAYCEELIGTL